MTEKTAPFFLSGADDHLLGNLFMLLDAVSVVDPGVEIKVCDFGFSPPVRHFLEEIGVLLPKPALLQGHDHPWYAKAAMGDFLPPAEMAARGFVWIDADIIPLRPFADDIAALADDMRAAGQSAALCPDDVRCSLSGFIDQWRERDRDIEPFAKQIKNFGVAPDSNYLNTGFLICTDAGLARAWRDLVLKQHVWLLFEQNSFNTLAHAAPEKIRQLDTVEWNAHGALLDDAVADGSGKARFVHATSAGDRHVDGELNLSVGGKSRKMNLKLFLREDLRRRQLAHLDRFMTGHAERLTECGVLR
jgi:hypothetical protein